MRQFVESVHNHLLKQQKQHKKAKISDIVQLSVNFISRTLQKQSNCQRNEATENKDRKDSYYDDKMERERANRNAIEIVEAVHEYALVMENDKNNENKLMNLLDKKLAFGRHKIQVLSNRGKQYVRQAVQDELGKELQLLDHKPTFYRVCTEMTSNDSSNAQTIIKQLDSTITSTLNKIFQTIQTKLEKVQSGQAQPSIKQVAAVLREEYKKGKNCIGQLNLSLQQIKNIKALQKMIRFTIRQKKVQNKQGEKGSYDWDDQPTTVYYQGREHYIHGDRLISGNKIYRIVNRHW